MIEQHHLDAATQAAAKLRQGSIIDFNITSWLIDPRKPLHSLSLGASLDADPDDVAYNVNANISSQSMVVSQSCDLARTPPNRYWVTLCPVVSAPEKQSELDGIQNGNNRRYVLLPWHPDFTTDKPRYADLHLMHTVERSMLHDITEYARPKEQQRRELAEALGRCFSRPALPPEVDVALKPLKNLANGKHSKPESADGIAFRAVDQIRVASTPDFDDPPPWDLELTFILTPGALPDNSETLQRRAIKLPRRESSAARLARALNGGWQPSDPPFAEMWREVIGGWVGRIRPTTPIPNRPTFKVVTALTPAELQHSDEVDLAHLSGS